MAASEPDGKVEVTVTGAKNLATLGKYRTDDKFCVKLSMGNQTYETKMQSRDRFLISTSVSWKRSFEFTFVGQMPDLTLTVCAEESNRKDIFIGRTILSHVALSSSGRPKIGTTDTRTFLLSDDAGRQSSKPRGPALTVSIKLIKLGDVEPIDEVTTAATLKEAHDAVQEASAALDEMQRRKIPGLSVELGQGTAVSEVAGPAAAIGSILKTIGVIADVMDALSEIHPYAKAAWKVLGFTWKVIKAQMQEDDNIRELSEQMKSLLDRVGTFVERLDTIFPDNTNTDEKNTLHDIVCASRDCATFIMSFCEQNFTNRAMKCALFGDAGKTIEGFKAKFESLEQTFNKKVWDGTSLGVRQILENQLTAQVAKFIVRDASLLASSHRSCHPETQVTIRKTLADWIDRVDGDVPRVLLLSGKAGTGKSTIAHTIAEEHAVQGKLYTSFAFSRRAQPPPSARMLFPHVAAFLATFYPAVKKCLAEKEDIASSVDLELQLRELVIEPLKQPRLNAPGPIVIVVDAIDEADSDGVQAAKLASLLATVCGQLPSNIRIFVTSRVETYVVHTTWPSAVQRLHMPESSDESLSEVRLFIKEQLKNVPDIGESQYDNLMTTSQGLYQWAATACKEIVGTPLLGGSTPLQRYSMVVASGIGRDKKGLLDLLYEDVLNRAFDSAGHPLLKQVIAVLFAMMESMTLDIFRELYNQLEFGEKPDVDCILPYLPSILDGISDRTRPVQPNHTSLRDFFLDPDRSGYFCVKDLMPGTHDRAARGSLKILSTSLLQVTCTLEFARLQNNYGAFRNSEYVQSEADCVQGEMSHHVGYATLYFTKHLGEAPAPEEAFWLDLGTSLLTDDCALRWIEIFYLLVARRLGYFSDASPEQSGSMQLLAHITKRQDSSCPPCVQSAVEHASTILCATSDPPFLFSLGHTLDRLGDIYELVAWTVKLQCQPEDGPLVPIGTGFFLYLYGASHDVILTTAHNLLDINECPRTDLVISFATQVPRLAGALQFSKTQFSVPPADIYVCADFTQRQQLETDWAAIRLPRGTALGDGFYFDLTRKDPGTVTRGTYGQLSWLSHRLHPPFNNSNTSADVMHTAVFADPVVSGAPIFALDKNYLIPIVRGIWNPTYGDHAHTKITPALIRELGSWLGLTGKSNNRLRWLCDSPDCVAFYLYVNEDVHTGEDSRLYLKHGSGSSFDVSLADSCSWYVLLGFGARVVDVLEEDDKDTDSGGCLACVSASEHEDERGLTAWMEQSANGDQQTSIGTLSFQHKDYHFFVKSALIAGPSHGDSELIKISLRRRNNEVKPGETEHPWLKFALE